jgi:hypothetical protein
MLNTPWPALTNVNIHSYTEQYLSVLLLLFIIIIKTLFIQDKNLIQYN